MILLELNLLATLCTLQTAFSIDSPTVILPSGKIQGKFAKSDVLKRQYAAFYSVPYAEPPIGQLRFKEPVPAKPWTGTLMATEFPPVCPQMDFSNPIPLKTLGTEDCLYLNVFTPQLPQDKLLLMDVIFVIHGGGYMLSTGNEIGAEKLMDRDVVLVTLNYRLGAFGFLSTEDQVCPGNNGLKDQLMALKWTKENIAYFGGDPNKVTISGFSAGGASVHLHLLSKMSKGLFQKAIMESGSSFSLWSLKEHPKKEAIKLASDLGCPTKSSEEIIECLKQKPSEHIILKQITEIFTMYPILQFTPSIEPHSPTAFLDRDPRQIMTSGEASDVPMLTSFSKDEALLFVGTFLSDRNKLKEIDDNWVDRVVPLITNKALSNSRRRQIAQDMRQRYLGDKSVEENKFGLVKMMSDWGVIGGVEEASKLAARTFKSPIYSYQFAYRGSVKFKHPIFTDDVYQGVNHCEQTLYVTPLTDAHISEDEPMLELMLNLTMNFIKGKPLAKKWKPIKEKLPKYSLFNISTTVWDENELEVLDDFSSLEFRESLKIKYEGTHSEL